jgi:hypothetical protein
MAWQIAADRVAARAVATGSVVPQKATEINPKEKAHPAASVPKEDHPKGVVPKEDHPKGVVQKEAHPKEVPE